jgi:hypothetical protein
MHKLTNSQRCQIISTWITTRLKNPYKSDHHIYMYSVFSTQHTSSKRILGIIGNYWAFFMKKNGSLMWSRRTETEYQKINPLPSFMKFGTYFFFNFQRAWVTPLSAHDDHTLQKGVNYFFPSFPHFSTNSGGIRYKRTSSDDVDKLCVSRKSVPRKSYFTIVRKKEKKPLWHFMYFFFRSG